MPRSELTLRVLFAVAAIPVVVAALYFGDWALAGLLSIAAALAAWELFAIARAAGHTPLDTLGVGVAALVPLALHARTLGLVRIDAVSAVLVVLACCAVAVWNRPPAARPLGAVAITVFGIVYSGVLLGFGYALRYHEFVLGSIDRAAGFTLLFFPVLLTWTSDTGAYFVGRAIGKRKLAPAVSPGKTVEGAIGGLALCVVVAVVYARYALAPHAHLLMLPGTAAVFGAVVSVATQCGDLFESLVKRESGVKDSSRLIPGHGGVLDRIDGLLFALPVAYWLIGILPVMPVPV
ncbi:MAG: phosphatidate cytidylyltransferase [Gemmatimonadaceae bacterium]